MKAKKIVLLAANPEDTTQLRLQNEFRAIDLKIRLSKKRDAEQITVVQKGAIRTEDLQQVLLDEEPQIVHFSGHGKSDGIILESPSQKAALVDPEALSELFKILRSGIDCVVLNACFSKPQAQAIAKHIPFVIGMKREIGDDAATEFSTGFYGGIGAGKSIRESYDLGCNAIRLQKIPEHLTPILFDTSQPLSDSKSEDSNTTSINTIGSPLSEREIKKIHVDREAEKKSFSEMLAGESDAHILIIEAESGMGKTNLMEQFWSMSKELQHAHVNFKDLTLSFGKILGELSRQFGENSFKHFNNQCLQFGQRHRLNTDQTLVIESQIDIILESLPLDKRANERQSITDAFFADLTAIHNKNDNRVVLLFDAYEKTNNEVKDWIDHQFIPGVRHYPWLICVVSGQESPKISMDWSDSWCLQHKLEPLNIDHVREYVQTVRLTYSEETIVILKKLSHGKPHTLKNLVLDLISGDDS